jgi:hypothetical protein
MPKIGTAIVEIRPVLDEATMQAISARIEQAVADGVARGLAKVSVAQSRGSVVRFAGPAATTID